MKVVDLTYINAAADGNPELVRALVDIFLSQLEESRTDLENAVSKFDWCRVAEVAHKAKGSILSMGMADLADAMERVELIAKAIYVEAVPPLGDKRSAEYSVQLDALPKAMLYWINNNKTTSMLRRLIDFYKSQAELATAELTAM